MAYIVMAYIVMSYIVTAYIAMAYIVMAYIIAVAKGCPASFQRYKSSLHVWACTCADV